MIGRRFRDADFYCTTACRYLLHDDVQIRALVEALRSLWMNADLHAVEVREIAVQRTFVDFEDFWTTIMMAATVNQAIAAMAPVMLNCSKCECAHGCVRMSPGASRTMPAQMR